MSHLRPRRVYVQSGLLAGLAAMLGGCLSAPQGPTSENTVSPTNGNVSIDSVAQRYIEANHFKRITEYFDDQENKGGHVVERTQPKERAGYYFIVDLDWHPGVVMPAGTKVVLDYIRGDNPTPRQAVFTFPKPASTWSEIFVGLTGSDWPSESMELVAYKLTIETADGTVLAQHKSFLWDLPELKSDAAAKAAGNSTATPAPSTAASTPVPTPTAVMPETVPATASATK